MDSQLNSIIEELNKPVEKRHRIRIVKAVETLCEADHKKSKCGKPVSLNLTKKEKDDLIDLLCKSEKDAFRMRD